MAAMVIGSIFMIFRAGAYMARLGGQPPHHFGAIHHYPSSYYGGLQSVQPIDLFLFQQTDKQVITRHIEVL